MTSRSTILSLLTRPALGAFFVVTIAAIACDQQRDGREGGAGIDGPKADDADEDGHSGVPADQPTGLDARFEAAAQAHDVPVELLQALSWIETRWQMVEGHEGHDARPAAFGLMALRGDALAEGAQLAGLTVQDTRHDPMANIEAAAALLSELADEHGIEDRTDIGAWAEVVVEYSGIDDEIAASSFVHREVYPTIREGVVAYTTDGEIQGELIPRDVWPSVGVPPPLPALQAGPDYSGSVWRPSPNNSSRGSGAAASAA
ncbi:MAG: transglycosylase SLT domain-containing protein, partial [Nannocystaceae bacterium]|nr:transglycosylase SLT domain-containing protein [Nannocystaceae bacterium]